MDFLIPIFDALGWGSYTQVVFGVLTGVVAIFGAISAAFPDSVLGKLAPLVNALGLNVGAAKNDPSLSE